MRRLEIGSLPLPRIYVCDNRADINICKSKGIPYLVWHGEYDMLVKLVLLPTLERMFPHIKWRKHLNLHWKDVANASRLKVKTYETHDEYPVDMETEENLVDGREVDRWIDDEVDALRTMTDEEIGRHTVNDSNIQAEFAESYRAADEHCQDLNKIQFSSTSLNDAVGDLTSMVNIQELQKLHLMPKWLGDIAEVVTKNIDDMIWQEGYNKKLGWPAGNYNGTTELSNLIILDVSASIPFGIAATMLSLIETLREQANADLIVTAQTSGWYSKDKSLPSPKELRKIHPRGQEYKMFNAILEEHVLGKEWGNVICFGDNDTPAKCIKWAADRGEVFSPSERILPEEKNRDNTSVKHIWSYHTGRNVGRFDEQPLTGYCRWCKIVSPDAEVTHNTAWAEMIDRD